VKSRLHRRKRKNLRSKEILYFLRKVIHIFIVIVAGTVVTALFLFVTFFRNKYYFSKPINSVIVYRDGISIVRFDPVYNEILTLNVNGNVFVDSSAGLGSYPLKNVYALSENEKKGEEMFKKTIMRNFHIPIYNIIDCRAALLNKRSLVSLIWTCPKGKDVDDILFLIFTKWRVGKNLTDKELDDYGGYDSNKGSGENPKLDENIFEDLELDFSQDIDISDIVNVSIITHEGDVVPAYLNDVIKLIGGRVVEDIHESIDEAKIKSCKVIGSNKVFIKNTGKVFNCKVLYTKNEIDTKMFFSEEYLTTF
jgi:hypothetical protein